MRAATPHLRAALRRGSLWIAAALGATACRALTSELQPDANTVGPRDIIAASSDATGTLAADGITTVRVAARIPRGSTVRTVAFATTFGTFVESGGRTVSIRAVDDSLHADKAVASTVLRSDTTAGVAIVRATIGDYYDTVSVRFVKHP